LTYVLGMSTYVLGMSTYVLGMSTYLCALSMRLCQWKELGLQAYATICLMCLSVLLLNR